MAQNDLPIADRLKQLYKLQLIDSQIDEIEILKGELPMEVNDLEDEVAGLQTRTGKLDQQIKDIEAEISKHKANIKDSEALIEKYDKQMTNVKNNREYEALSKELEMQKLEEQVKKEPRGKMFRPGRDKLADAVAEFRKWKRDFDPSTFQKAGGAPSVLPAPGPDPAPQAGK